MAVTRENAVARADSSPFAVVTGASTGIGFELAKLCAQHGYNLVIAANEPAIHGAAEILRRVGARVKSVETDLATEEGVSAVYAAVKEMGRPVDALFANAGHGLGGAFLDQDFQKLRHVVDTNVIGTIALIHRIGRDMRERGAGRILIVGSIAGLIPGSFQAVYNGSKAFLDNFAYALRNELKDSGVVVTCLMPGPTETEFFRRAEMLDTKVGSESKADAAVVARDGFEALMKGQARIVSGWKNRIQAALSGVTPPETLAESHRKLAEPGTGRSAH